MTELKLKKCLKCGSLVKVIVDCACKDCGITCCGEQMMEVKANSVDAAFEKHIPNYKVIGDEMHITVNHVMDEDHYIEWILVKTETGNIEKFFNAGDDLELVVPYTKGSIIYSYCNKHGLWKKSVE